MWSEFWIHQWLCPIHLWNGRVNVSNCIKEQRFYLFFALCIKLLQATSKSRQAGDDRTWQSIAYNPFCLTYAWSARMLCHCHCHWTRDLSISVFFLTNHLKEGDIGRYPIPQYRKKKWQIPKHRVENRLNTDTAYLNHIYIRFRMYLWLLPSSAFNYLRHLCTSCPWFFFF